MGTTEGEGVGLPTGAVGRGMKEWWDQRGGRASRGVMKFVWDTLEFFFFFYGYCALPAFPLLLTGAPCREAARQEEAESCRCRVSFFTNKKIIIIIFLKGCSQIPESYRLIGPVI